MANFINKLILFGLWRGLQIFYHPLKRLDRSQLSCFQQIRINLDVIATIKKNVHENRKKRFLLVSNFDSNETNFDGNLQSCFGPVQYSRMPARSTDTTTSNVTLYRNMQTGFVCSFSRTCNGVLVPWPSQIQIFEESWSELNSNFV